MYWPNWPIDPDEKFDSRNQAGRHGVMEWSKARSYLKHSAANDNQTYQIPAVA